MGILANVGIQAGPVEPSPYHGDAPVCGLAWVCVLGLGKSRRSLGLAANVAIRSPWGTVVVLFVDLNCVRSGGRYV